MIFPPTLPRGYHMDKDTIHYRRAQLYIFHKYETRGELWEAVWKLADPVENKPKIHEPKWLLDIMLDIIWDSVNEEHYKKTRIKFIADYF